MTMANRWILTSQKGFENSLQYEEGVPLPTELGPRDVLVELHAASLNYRELVIANAEVRHDARF